MISDPLNSHKEKIWSDIQKRVSNCFECGLHTEGTNPIFGEGSLDAKIVFIGEAPGITENQLKRPFVGASGQILNEFLKKIGLSRESVFISNIVKCRPPNNRDPLLREINACTPYLIEQINLLKADLVVTLGRFAARFFLSDFRSMAEINGIIFNLEDRSFKLLPMYHPATCLYNRPKYYPIFEKDFELIKNVLTEKESRNRKKKSRIMKKEKLTGLDQFL